MQSLVQNAAILEAALIGYQIRRNEIETKIHSVRQQLAEDVATAGGTWQEIATALVTPVSKRSGYKMSEEARKRIAAGQKKRWKRVPASRSSYNQVALQIFSTV